MAAVAKPKPAEKELTLGQTAQGFAKNLLPSTGEALSGVWSAVTNPGETLGALKQLGTGAVSKGIGAFGQKQDVATKAKDESMLNALLGHYKQTYGSAAGFKKALATDPASIMMDASSFLGGAGLAAKGAGLAKTASTLGKIAEFSDPVQLALKAAKVPFQAVGKAAPSVQSLTTGASATSLAKAAEAATAKATPEQRAAFKAQMTKRNAPELVDALDDALEAANKKKSTEYVNSMKAATNGVLPPLNWHGINTALSDNFKSIQFRDPNTGFAVTKHPGAERALQEIANAANQFASQPIGSTAHTLEGFDALKQMIGDIRSGYKNDPHAYRVATDMYNKTLKEIGAKHPEYADIMKQYGSASDEIKAMKDQFGVGRNLSDQKVLQKVMKSKFGKGEASQDLLSSMAQHNPNLPFMIAGYELSSVLPGGLRQALMYASPGIAMASVPGAVVHLAASSPRAMGSVNYAAGRIGRGVDLATQQAVTKPLSYASHAADAVSPLTPQEGPSAPMKAQEVEKQGIVNKEPQDVPELDQIMEGLHARETSGTDQYGETDPYKQRGTVVEKGPYAGQRAMGKYQVMPGNLPEWSKAALGREVSVDEFIASPEIQEAIARFKAAQLYKRYGNVQDVQSAWFAGGPLAARAGRRDDNGTSVEQYVAGRPGRASGGRVDKNRHEFLVNRLIKMAKDAKTVSDKTTEPLLNAPDTAVVKALDIAQRAI